MGKQYLLQSLCSHVSPAIACLWASPKQVIPGCSCTSQTVQINLEWDGVLILAGIIFFLAASVGPYFGLVVRKNIDKTRMVFYCWAVLSESRCFLLLTLPHQRIGWRYTRCWEETQLRQPTPADPRDIP